MPRCPPPAVTRPQRPTRVARFLRQRPGGARDGPCRSSSRHAPVRPRPFFNRQPEPVTPLACTLQLTREEWAVDVRDVEAHGFGDQLVTLPPGDRGCLPGC